MAFTGAGDSNLMKVLGWVVEVTPEVETAHVNVLRAKYPNASNEQLARKVFSGARWKATATGVLTGLPANLALAIPAAAGDVAAVLRLEVLAAARVALIYDPDFFAEEDAAWELLVPIFGIDVVSQVGREAGVRAGMNLTRRAIRAWLSKGTLKEFQRIMAKYLGIKVTQRAVITKTVPVIGGLIGGGWNFGEVTLQRRRCIAYFSGLGLATRNAES